MKNLLDRSNAILPRQRRNTTSAQCNALGLWPTIHQALKGRAIATHES